VAATRKDFSRVRAECRAKRSMMASTVLQQAAGRYARKQRRAALRGRKRRREKTPALSQVSFHAAVRMPIANAGGTRGTPSRLSATARITRQRSRSESSRCRRPLSMRHARSARHAAAGRAIKSQTLQPSCAAIGARNAATRSSSNKRPPVQSRPACLKWRNIECR